MFVGEIFWTAVIGFALIGGVGYFLSIYNGLVALRNNIERSWSNIDVLLKQRHDELPKLIKTCEGYMQHERAGVRQAVRGTRRAGRGAVDRRARRGRGHAHAGAGRDLRGRRGRIRTSRRISRSSSCRAGSAISRTRSPIAASTTTTP